MTLVWAGRALADLDRIVRHIARDNVSAAFAMEERIVEAVERLIEHPMRGRKGKLAGTYELVVPRTPYIVVYRLGGDAIGVSRVMHGRQQWPPAQ